MRKLIAGINMSLDGFCDHTSMMVHDDMHEHFSELIRNAGLLIYGRTTYQLMESYWPLIVKNPTGNKSTDEFAVMIDRIPKIVFSRTLKNVAWHSAKLANREIEEEVLELKEQEGRDILVGSPSLIAGLTQLGLIDEYQLCVHPVIAGKGLLLFKNITAKKNLKLIKTKVFDSGPVVLYYEPSGR